MPERREMLEFLQNPLDAASSRLAEVAALFLMPFLREDLAVVAGGLLIVEDRMPAGLAFASLVAGIFASDMLLFGLGRLAQRSARVRRLLLRPQVERISSWLLEHTVTAMIVARIVPGVIFPVYVGLGLLGVRKALFIPVTLLTAAPYIAAMLWLVIRFGESVLAKTGIWAWVALAAVLVVASLRLARNPPWAALLRLSGSGAGARVRGARQRLSATLAGMPSLRGLTRRIGSAERIPPKLFYLPVALHWLWLALRFRSLSLATIANPLIEVGGLWGETKTGYLDMVSGDERRWIARYVALARGLGDSSCDTARALSLARGAGLHFPLVAKPDIGWQGYGVRVVGSEAELDAYLAAFPAGATMLLQELVGWDGEAGVFYARMPGEAEGKVISITLRYFPYVVGDGESTVRELILADERAAFKAGMHLGLEAGHGGVAPELLEKVPGPGELVRLSFIGSIRVGGLYRDAQELITPELSRRFDEISQSMQEFHYGRYDVRFASIERLREGEDFRIIEINGAGSEAISAWDPETPLGRVYARLLRHQRLMFEIGARNRARGWKPAGPWAVLRAAWHQTRLIKQYPPSS